MVWVAPQKLLLVYCHTTSADRNHKKSKIISFNFNKTDPSPTVYFSNYQAPPNRGKIMRLNKAQNWLLLAECANAGSYSNCNLRVLGDLTPNQPKFNFTVKIEGCLKEFDVIDNDKVVVLTNDNKIQIFQLGRTGIQEQITDLGSILPKNSPSKLCNLHVCPRNKLIGVSVCTTKAIGLDPIFEKIMLYCINTK